MEPTDFTANDPAVNETRIALAEEWKEALQGLAQETRLGKVIELSEFARDQLGVGIPGSSFGVHRLQQGELALTPVVKADQANLAQQYGSRDARRTMAEELGSTILFEPEANAIYVTSRDMTKRGKGVLLLGSIFDAKKHAEGKLPQPRTGEHWTHRAVRRKLTNNVLFALDRVNFSGAVDAYAEVVANQGSDIGDREDFMREDAVAETYLNRMFGKMGVCEQNIWWNAAYEGAIFQQQDDESAIPEFANYLRRINARSVV